MSSLAQLHREDLQHWGAQWLFYLAIRMIICFSIFTPSEEILKYFCIFLILSMCSSLRTSSLQYFPPGSELCFKGVFGTKLFGLFFKDSQWCISSFLYLSMFPTSKLSSCSVGRFCGVPLPAFFFVTFFNLSFELKVVQSPALMFFSRTNPYR